MANPFTRFLRTLRGDDKPDIEVFVAWWDVVEAIVVDVHKRGNALPEEREAYVEARTELLRNYKEVWAARFAPHWVETLEAGQRPVSDPFARILTPTVADGFVKNWAALQALASARETLNRYILSIQ